MRSMEEEKAKAENCFSDEAFNEYVNEEVKKTNLALKRYVYELSFFSFS